ncbi:MAG: penicillin-binding transpeptidase domain-containing protein, partial [Minisyncoccia bacterium]
PKTVRSALQESRNIPAVKMLYMIGLDDAMKTARNLGVTLSGDKDQYGLSLVLGGGEVSLLDMVTGYATLANNGVHQPIVPILKIEDSSGNTIENTEIKNGEQVISTEAVSYISNVLSDNNARIPTFGANSSLYVPGYEVAAKTGTTNNNKDAWLIGYTPSIAVGVWSGNNDNTPMKSGGGTVAGPTWNEFMKFVLPTIPKEEFPTPAQLDKSLSPILRGSWYGGEYYTIDTISGGLATEYTPEETKKEIGITNIHDTLYWVDKNNPTNGKPSNPSSDPLFNNFETGVQIWWNQHKQNYPNITLDQKPKYYDNIHTAQTIPTVSVSNNQVYVSGKNLVVSYTYQTVKPFRKAQLYVNNVLITESNTQPFTLPIDSIKNIDSTNKIKIVVFDTDYNKNQAEINMSF